VGGGTLYAGGWLRGAWPYGQDATIDLTGKENPSPVKIEAKSGESAWRNALGNTKDKDIECGPWLSLPIQDLSVPDLDAGFWHCLKLDVGQILLSGTDLLIACDGGHGRTGLAVSILAYLFKATHGCPITWLRNRYCDQAVESEEQVYYVYEMLGLGEPPEEIMPPGFGAWYYEGDHLVHKGGYRDY